MEPFTLLNVTISTECLFGVSVYGVSVRIFSFSSPLGATAPTCPARIGITSHREKLDCKILQGITWGNSSVKLRTSVKTTMHVACFQSTLRCKRFRRTEGRWSVEMTRHTVRKSHEVYMRYTWNIHEITSSPDETYETLLSFPCFSVN